MSDMDRSMEIRVIDKMNVAAFAGMMTEDAVNGILMEDGTSAITVVMDDEYAGVLAGRAVSDYEYEISSIYVKEDCRRRKAGTFLLDSLTDILQGLSSEISLSLARVSEEDGILADFLEAYGFEEYEGDHVYSTDVKAVTGLSLMQMKVNHSFTTLDKVTKKMTEELEASGKEDFMPLPEGGFDDPKIDKSLSLVYENEGSIKGYVIVERLSDDVMMFSHLYMDRSMPQTVWLSMIITLLKKVNESCKPEMKILIPMVNPKLEAWMETIMPEEDIDEVSACYRLRIERDDFDYRNGSLSDLLEVTGAVTDDYLFVPEDDEL